MPHTTTPGFSGAIGMQNKAYFIRNQIAVDVDVIQGKW